MFLDQVDALGISVKNANGSLRSSGDVLADFADKFAAMDGSPEAMAAGFAARAAEAHLRIIGGQDAPDLKRIVVTQDDYYRLLARDLENARNRVVFYSAFLTQNRVAYLEPHLRALVERGVPTYVVTKTLGERSASQAHAAQLIERDLSAWGVHVMHKLRMHEKLVFVDGDILWSGSLNSLSFSDTQEVMERRVSRAVVDDYSRILRLEALISAHTAEQETERQQHLDQHRRAQQGQDEEVARVYVGPRAHLARQVHELNEQNHRRDHRERSGHADQQAAQHIAFETPDARHARPATAVAAPLRRRMSMWRLTR